MKNMDDNTPTPQEREATWDKYTYSLLAMTPAVSVDPLLPPHPTSITLHHKSRKVSIVR